MFNSLFSIKNKGFTFLELIITIFVVTIGLLSAYAVTQQIVSFTYLSASRLTAAYLAKEGIEIVRNIRDTNWLEEEEWDNSLDCDLSSPYECEADYNAQELIDDYDGDFLNIDGNGFYSYSAGAPTKFRRRITVDDSVADVLGVTVEVWWREKGVVYGPVSAQEKLYNWRY